jgi:hypothetical protein
LHLLQSGWKHDSSFGITISQTRDTARNLGCEA